MKQILKRKYEKPTMTVVKLNNRQHLLQASPATTTLPLNSDPAAETINQW